MGEILGFMAARFDRKSVSVIVLGVLFFAIYMLLIIHRTYRCRSGRGIVVTSPNANVLKICKDLDTKQSEEEN